MKRFVLMGLLLSAMSLLTAACCSTRCSRKTEKTSAENKRAMLPQKIAEETPRNSELKANKNPYSMLPPIVIYKTRADYRHLVPIQISETGEVLSFPSASDLGTLNHYAYPVELADGYLWDQRGVGLRSVFLDLTYEEYAALERPSTDMLLRHIRDKKPFTFLAVCDRSHLQDETAEGLNRYIAQGMPGANILINEIDIILSE